MDAVCTKGSGGSTAAGGSGLLHVLWDSPVLSQATF